MLHLLARLVRAGFLAGKKLAETWTPQLILPLLPHNQLTESLFELLSDLLKASTTNTSLSDDNWDLLVARLVFQIDKFNDVNNVTACRTLRHALQILQKL